MVCTFFIINFIYTLFLKYTFLFYLKFMQVNLEKENHKLDLNSQHIVRQLQEANKSRKRLEFEKETLITQHIMDIEKLQQDTIHWKNL